MLIVFDMTLEIACFNLDSCFIAQNAGADRIEFCANYTCGGITPSLNEILKAREIVTIPLHIIIRPREGNFLYAQAEIDKMKSDILFCKENKIDGVVFGILDDSNKINRATCKELLELSKPMKVTFHRAIDSCEDIFSGIQVLIDLGFDTVLTSGGKNKAIEGKEILRSLQQQFGKKISIMPGGGIRSTNIYELKNTTNCKAFHSAALPDDSELVNSQEIKALQSILLRF